MPWRVCGGAWVQKLRDRYQNTFNIINSSGWGRDSRWGLSRFKRRVLLQNPTVVLIEFAINDSDQRRGISVDESEQNLHTLLSILAELKPETRVIVMTTNVVTGRHVEHRPALEEYYQASRKAAEDLGYAVCDMAPAWRQLLEESPEKFNQFVPDGIHPGGAAAEFIFEKVDASLNQVLKQTDETADGVGST